MILPIHICLKRIFRHFDGGTNWAWHCLIIILTNHKFCRQSIYEFEYALHIGDFSLNIIDLCSSGFCPKIELSPNKNNIKLLDYDIYIFSSRTDIKRKTSHLFSSFLFVRPHLVFFYFSSIIIWHFFINKYNSTMARIFLVFLVFTVFTILPHCVYSYCVYNKMAQGTTLNVQQLDGQALFAQG